MARIALIYFAVLAAIAPRPAGAQAPKKTLVAVFAHADDEAPVAPVLARYAREGAEVYMILATDGSQGGSHTDIARGSELARVRGEEALCATDALGMHPPIILGFPDGKLGDYIDDPARLFRLTQRVQEELQRLHPDALITWGPDGGTGHPDHRIVSSIVTQLVRAGAPGVPERLFYASIPAEGMRAMNPSRGAPPFVVPQQKYFTVHVPFSEADFAASRRSMACHKSQFPGDIVPRLTDLMNTTWNGVLPLIPAGGASTGADLFQPSR